jgi:tight adherence protein B
MLPYIIIGVIVIVILVGVGIYISSSSERNLVEDRLGRYLEDDKPKADQGQPQKSQLSDWVNKSVEKSSIGETVAKSLAQADLKFKPGEFFALIIILAIGLGAAGFIAGGQQLLSFGIGAVIGAVLPIVYLRTQQGRRLANFNNQLPDMLNLMVNGLRAGYSTMQALEAVSRELPPPINEEFRRVVQEMQLGVPMDKALDNLLRRIPSDDLDFVVTAINVQREVGGPLADILDSITFTIRERIRIKGEVKVMTSQVQLSGGIITFIPFGLFVVLWFMNPAYMGQLFLPENFVCGAIAIGVGLFMVGLGYFIMQKIANIEV